MYLIRDVVLLLLSISLAQSRSTKVFRNATEEEIVRNNVCGINTVSAIIERENNAGEDDGKLDGDYIITQGDIMVYTGLQNADPCTAGGCKWPRSPDKKVYVPYVISGLYSCSEREVIQSGLDSFKKSSCVHFIPHSNEEHYIDIISDKGCYSSVGRRTGRQVLSLKRPGCVYFHTVQHELLHALGFHHEQERSDRNRHVRILLQNVKPNHIHNFKIEPTNNLNTPYDYNSVMHYGRCFFSRNGEPTMIPIPDNNVPIGRATEMSPTDILRVNRLYCT